MREALSTGDGLGAPPRELALLKPPNQGTWSETLTESLPTAGPQLPQVENESFVLDHREDSSGP